MASMEVENHLDFEVLELFDRAIQDQVGYAERCLEALGEDLRSRGFRIRWEVRRSLPATEVAEIVGCAKREGVDLVLFSAPKSSRLSRLLFPSTAEQVARQLGVPVTLVVDHWKAGDRGGLSSAHAR
jgi:nucleotide-binding universal stress UspA family protein